MMNAVKDEFALVAETVMDNHTGGSEPMKIQAIRDCLERQFVDVKFSQTTRPTFTFRNGASKVSWLLVLNAEFLADMPLEELRRFLEEKVIKKILANPGKRIQISKYRDITVEERNLP
jgi:hypothetical protein